VFQDFGLIPGKSALHNTEFRLILAGVPGPERLTRARRALNLVGLDNRHGHTPEQLSGGQQQRVAIARALVSDADIILADEPTGNLDSAMGREILMLLAALARDGRTVLMVTHDPSATHYAQRIIRLCDGRIVTDSVAAMPTTMPPDGQSAAWPASEIGSDDGPAESAEPACGATRRDRAAFARAARRWFLGQA
jgi:putative ABC transport system ATP-binding protein